MFETENFEISTTGAPPLYPDPGEDVVWDYTLKETLLTTGWQGAGFKFPETYVSLPLYRPYLFNNQFTQTNIRSIY